MNEPGFRFCGSCGSRQQDSVVPAASQAAGGGGTNGGGANFGPSIGTGQEQGLAPAELGTDGAGAPALVAPRPRRSSGMSSASSLVVPGRSRAPLVALLVVDLGLAIGGGVLLRAGLAKPAVAAVGEPSSSSSAPGASAAPIPEAPSAGAPSDAAAAAAAGASGTTTPAPAPAPPPAAPPPSPSNAPASNAPSGEREPSDSQLAAADPKQAPPSAGAPAANAKREATAPKRPKGSSAPNATEETINPYPSKESPSVAAAFKQGQRALDDCYTKHANRSGAVDLAVSYSVAEDGSFAGVNFLRTVPDGALFEACVKHEIAKWRVKPGASTGKLPVHTITFGKGRK